MGFEETRQRLAELRLVVQHGNERSGLIHGAEDDTNLEGWVCHLGYTRRGGSLGTQEEWNREWGKSGPLSLAESQPFGGTNEVGEGDDPHLLHHAGAMHFDGVLAGAEVSGNLFVQLAGDD